MRWVSTEEEGPGLSGEPGCGGETCPPRDLGGGGRGHQPLLLLLLPPLCWVTLDKSLPLAGLL